MSEVEEFSKIPIGPLPLVLWIEDRLIDVAEHFANSATHARRVGQRQQIDALKRCHNEISNLLVFLESQYKPDKCTNN